MTPRESLEAAGWKARYPEAEARWFSPDISDSATYSQKDAIAQLARDEAKETSDGRASSNQHGGISLPSIDTTGTDSTQVGQKVTAPVAMSVSAPDERHEAEDAYTISAFDYERDPVGSRDWTLFWKGWQKASEGASSSSAAGIGDFLHFANRT